VYIHSNYFHGGNMEFIYTGDTTPHNGDVWVYNNVMRENTNGSGGMFFAWGTRNAYVYNNTLYGMRGEGMVAIAGSAQVYSRNNIWRSTGTQNIAIETDQGGRFNSQNDLFYGAAVPSGAGITVSSSMTADPLFVSTADLHLTSGSPARDAGTSSVSEIVTRSYDGITRPQDSGYDLGAYESGTGTGSGTELVSYVMPQVAFGGGWSTSLFLTNMGTTAADVTASFYADNGTALAVPVQGGTATTIPVSMPAGSTSRIELTSAGAVSQGWALVQMPVSVRGFGIFSLSVNGNAAQEAVIPMSEDSLQSYSMIWDDTGFDTSMSIANPGDTAVVVNFTVRLASGTQIGTGTINLSAKEKRAFVARTQFNLPSMQGAHGSMDISVASGKLAVLGLRFGPLAFTTIPAAVK
ncbi:MAG TPA: choice-of-anchor Q domain-containing protein, partial [Bryobacteraceae bacterium]|nr:choice-of-anchor Q domain-containing protein [Bryobacteraceae bacterium]